MDEKFNADQLREIRYGLECGLSEEQVNLYATPEFDDEQMTKIRTILQGMKRFLDVKEKYLHTNERIECIKDNTTSLLIKTNVEGSHETYQYEVYYDDKNELVIEDTCSYINLVDNLDRDIIKMSDNIDVINYVKTGISSKKFLFLNDYEKLKDYENSNGNILEPLNEEQKVILLDILEGHDYSLVVDNKNLLYRIDLQDINFAKNEMENSKTSPIELVEWACEMIDDLVENAVKEYDEMDINIPAHDIQELIEQYKKTATIMDEAWMMLSNNIAKQH